MFNFGIRKVRRTHDRRKGYCWLISFRDLDFMLIPIKENGNG